MIVTDASLQTPKKVLRATVGVMFFLAGLTFASWASRIAVMGLCVVIVSTKAKI